MGLFAQEVDLDQLSPSDVDLSKVNLDNVQFYFHGPMELYVSGVQYNGQSYAAVLDYDGGTTVDVKVPQRVTTQGKPNSVDLSNISVAMGEDGLILRNVVVNGDRYQGTIAYNPGGEPGRIVGANMTARGVEGDGNVQQLRNRISELENQVSELREERDSLQSQISEMEQQEGDERLRTRIEQLNDQIAEQENLIERGRDRIAELEADIEEKNNLIDRGRDQIAELRSQLEEARAGEEPRRVTADDRLNTVLSGMARGTVGLGNWTRQGDRFAQTDSGQKFAKYVVSQRQDSSELLYSFTGRANGSGWRGYGLHFLASDYDSTDKYGLGSSYLVWVTRDPAAYQTDQTFVQLYKSFSDVHMVQVASKAIDSSITSSNDFEVYVNRNNNQISVSANGNHVFTVNDTQMYRSGSGMALRALGNAEFSSFTLKSR
jgi:hypothetical protein